MWFLITTVILNHHTIRKELLHVVLHTAISTLGVYQDSRFCRNTSILSDLALYLLFICNGRKVFLLLFSLLSLRIRSSPIVNIFIRLQSLSHKCSFHTKGHANVTVPITLERLMTVRFLSVSVGLYSSTDGNL